MSLSTVAVIYCDGKKCNKFFHVTKELSVVNVRLAAAKKGWGYLAPHYIRVGPEDVDTHLVTAKDFCPRHKVLEESLDTVESPR